MNIVKEIEKINKEELRLGISESGSWHDKYKNSAYVFASGLDYVFSEGDVICIFSQFGEVVDCNLARHKVTGKSLGYVFIAYEDQRSSVLAVDNFNGARIRGRVIRCDHVKKYRKPVPKTKELESDSEAEEGQSDEDYDERRKQIWNQSLYESSEESVQISSEEETGKMRVKKKKKGKKKKKKSKKERKAEKKAKKRVERFEKIRGRRALVREEEIRNSEMLEDQKKEYINQVEYAKIQKDAETRKKVL